MRRLMLITILAVVLMLTISAPSLAATNLVVNGNFESGATGFTSDYALVTTASTSGGAYGLGSLDLEGQYAVGANPNLYHALWASVEPHSASNMMIVNGNELTSPAPTLYATSATVVPGHVYSFSFFGATSYAGASANISIEINGVSVGTYDAPATPPGWKEFYTAWDSGTATVANIELVDTNMTHTGNDFAIDDVSLFDLGSKLGKTTGGIKFNTDNDPTGVTGVDVQLEFVAISSTSGAKGVVNYKASNGNEFTGKVTGYFQNADGTTACFVGAITKTNVAGWDYFYVAVRDYGEGAGDPADEGARVQAGSAPYLANIADASGHWEAFTGNVQIH